MTRGYYCPTCGCWCSHSDEDAERHHKDCPIAKAHADAAKLAALGNILQPLLQDDVEGLARELRWLDTPVAHEAAQLLEDTLASAKRHGVIKDGSGEDAGSEDEWNRATPLGSLAEATKRGRG